MTRVDVRSVSEYFVADAVYANTHGRQPDRIEEGVAYWRYRRATGGAMGVGRVFEYEDW